MYVLLSSRAVSFLALLLFSLLYPRQAAGAQSTTFISVNEPQSYQLLTPTASYSYNDDITTLIDDALTSPPSPSNTNHEDLIIYTDLALNTIVTLTRSTTPYIPVPSVGVPPPFGAVPTTTQSESRFSTATSSVDTFIQATYTGGAVSSHHRLICRWVGATTGLWLLYVL